jgi:hypothetical protein
MTTPAIVIILVMVVGIVSIIVYRIIVFKRASRQTAKKRLERIQPLYDKLASGHPITEDDVYEYAKTRSTRETVYRLLQYHDLIHIFPAEFLTIIRGAESNLANWLEFPTELNAFPDEMEHIQRVSIDYDGQSHIVYYEVFKFRMEEPHPAAKVGWLLGVVGPYFDDSKPYDPVGSTFSRLSSKFGITSAEEEAKWVHDNIAKRR